MIGPGGERWVPVHGIVPLSKGPETLAEVDAAFEDMREELRGPRRHHGYLITSLSTTGYLVEPVFLCRKNSIPSTKSV
jgi:D-lactate dehydrogenase (cytochrome)